MSTNIAPPSGRPFATVGTDEARLAIEEMEADAANAPFTDQDANATRARLVRDVLAHRDYLHAQVGDLQAARSGTKP